jgi:hypothetical protein
MELDQIVGPATRADGLVDGPVRVGRQGAAIQQDAHGKFYEAVRIGQVYYLSSVAAAGTAYAGGAAGTPLLCAHNPTGSGVNLELLAVGLTLRAQATAASEAALNVFAGASALPTGTSTTPRSALTQAASGGKSVGFVNAAMTGSTALNLALPLFTYYWATAAAAFASPGLLPHRRSGRGCPGRPVRRRTRRDPHIGDLQRLDVLGGSPGLSADRDQE